MLVHLALLSVHISMKLGRRRGNSWSYSLALAADLPSARKCLHSTGCKRISLVVLASSSSTCAKHMLPMSGPWGSIPLPTHTNH